MRVMLRCPNCLTLNNIENARECVQCESIMTDIWVEVSVALEKDNVIHPASFAYMINGDDDLDKNELKYPYSPAYVTLFSSIVDDERNAFLASLEDGDADEARVDFLGALRNIFELEFESHSDALWFIIPRWYSILHKVARENEEWMHALASFKYFVAIVYIDYAMASGYRFKGDLFSWERLSDVVSALRGPDLVNRIDVSSANSNIGMTLDNPILDLVLKHFFDRNESVEHLFKEYAEYKSMFDG